MGDIDGPEMETGGQGGDYVEADSLIWSTDSVQLHKLELYAPYFFPPPFVKCDMKLT